MMRRDDTHPARKFVRLLNLRTHYRPCCRCGQKLRFTQYTCSNCGHNIHGCTGRHQEEK